MEFYFFHLNTQCCKEYEKQEEKIAGASGKEGTGHPELEMGHSLDYHYVGDSGICWL